MRSQRRQQLRVALVDVLERHALRALHEVDEAQVARAEDDHVALGRLLVLALGGLLGAARRLIESARDASGVLVAGGDRVDARLAGERLRDEVLEPVAVALLEGRALRLAVVGEDDDLVRPRRVAPGPLDRAEALVELAERLEGVRAFE